MKADAVQSAAATGALALKDLLGCERSINL